MPYLRQYCNRTVPEKEIEPMKTAYFNDYVKKTSKTHETGNRFSIKSMTICLQPFKDTI